MSDQAKVRHAAEKRKEFEEAQTEKRRRKEERRAKKRAAEAEADDSERIHREDLPEAAAVPPPQPSSAASSSGQGLPPSLPPVESAVAPASLGDSPLGDDMQGAEPENPWRDFCAVEEDEGRR